MDLLVVICHMQGNARKLVNNELRINSENEVKYKCYKENVCI